MSPTVNYPFLRRLQTVVIAILLGLSWIPIVMFVNWLKVRWHVGALFPAALSPGDPYEVDNLTHLLRLVLGLSFCLLLVPALLRPKMGNYREFLRLSGVTGFQPNGVFLTLVMVVSTVVLSSVFSALYGVHEGSFLQMLGALNPFSVGGTWFANIQPPLFEELLYRGIVFGLLQKYFRPWVAVLLSSLLFGYIHLISQGLFSFVWSFAFALTLFSILRLITGSIWASVFAHFVVDNAAFTVIPIGTAFLITVGVALLQHFWRKRKRLTVSK